jgi:hypothetical protein
MQYVIQCVPKQAKLIITIATTPEAGLSGVRIPRLILVFNGFLVGEKPPGV